MNAKKTFLMIVALSIFMGFGGLAWATDDTTVPQTLIYRPSGDKLIVQSGGEIEIKSGGLLDLQSGSTVYSDGNITTTGDDVDIATHVVVAGNVTVTGTITGSNYATEASSGSFTHQLVVGQTTAKSTFTPTALALDDGLTLTVNGSAVLAGGIVSDGNITTTGDDVDVSTHLAVAGNAAVTGIISSSQNKRGITANSQTIYEVLVSTQLADSQEYEISEMDGKIGWGYIVAVGSGSFAGSFSFIADGTVTLGSHTGMTTSDNNDTTLNVFDAGTTIKIENQLGGTFKLMVTLYYIQ